MNCCSSPISESHEAHSPNYSSIQKPISFSIPASQHQTNSIEKWRLFELTFPFRYFWVKKKKNLIHCPIVEAWKVQVVSAWAWRLFSLLFMFSVSHSLVLSHFPCIESVHCNCGHRRHVMNQFNDCSQRTRFIRHNQLGANIRETRTRNTKKDENTSGNIQCDALHSCHTTTITQNLMSQ